MRYLRILFLLAFIPILSCSQAGNCKATEKTAEKASTEKVKNQNEDYDSILNWDKKYLGYYYDSETKMCLMQLRGSISQVTCENVFNKLSQAQKQRYVEDRDNGLIPGVMTQNKHAESGQ